MRHHLPRPPARHGAAWNVAGLALLIVMGHPCARADDASDAPSVTPYRPSVSTPAALSAPGWLELELGGVRARGGDPMRRDSLPYTLKYAWSPDWGIRIGGDAVVRQRAEGADTHSGLGDSAVVLKRRFAIDEASAFGLEGGVSLNNGRRGIGSGGADATLNGIYSADLGPLHTDLNLAATRLGRPDAGAARTVWLGAASLSGSLGDRWGWVAELSGTRQGAADSTSQGLAALSYSVARGLTVDAGLSHSLHAGPADRAIFAGFTYLVGRP